MAGFRTVGGRMLFWTLAVTIPIYAGALYMAYQATAHRLEADAVRGVDDLAVRLAAGLDAVIRPIEGGVRTVAGQLEEVDPPRDQYQSRIRGILQAWPQVYGSTIAVEAGPGGAPEPFAPYLFRQGTLVGYSDLARESYGYRDLPWYRNAADTGEPVWSQPYFDEGGGDTWMITYSVPFFRRVASGERALAGIITADLALDWMERVVADTSLGSAGLGWLYTANESGSFIVPIGDTAARKNRFDPSLDEDSVRALADRMLETDVRFARLPAETSRQPAYIAVRDLETLHWRIVLVIPREQLLADARTLLQRQLWLGAAGLILLSAAIYIVAAGISRPLHALAEAVASSSPDEPDFRLPARNHRDEIAVLTDALRRMRDSLRKHIQLRAESLAEQARLEHELQIAANIQQSMLPRHDPRSLPPAAKVAAALLPARQVGGDLYDYFQVRDDQLLFAIGDVSDKGIPAALFMARLSGLLRVLGTAGELPHRLLAAINARLADSNEACMFVTLGCGLLNVATGQVRYASAGHEAPLLRNVEGTVRSLAADNGPAIGIETVADYRLVEGFIAPGDTLVLFTDGVTEARDCDGSLYGMERFGALLSESADGEPSTLVQRIVDTVAAHASHRFHADDDLTVLAIRLNPPDVAVYMDDDHTPHWLIEPALSDEGVRNVQSWLRAILSSRDVAGDAIGDAELIAEEALTNAMRALARRPDAFLSFECVLHPQLIELNVRDNGPPFDPLARAEPDLDADIGAREIGGLGIFLIKQLADSCRYAHLDGRNVFTAVLRRTAIPSTQEVHHVARHTVR